MDIKRGIKSNTHSMPFNNEKTKQASINELSKAVNSVQKALRVVDKPNTPSTFANNSRATLNEPVNLNRLHLACIALCNIDSELASKKIVSQRLNMVEKEIDTVRTELSFRTESRESKPYAHLIINNTLDRAFELAIIIAETELKTLEDMHPVNAEKIKIELVQQITSIGRFLKPLSNAKRLTKEVTLTGNSEAIQDLLYIINATRDEIQSIDKQLQQANPLSKERVNSMRDTINRLLVNNRWEFQMTKTIRGIEAQSDGDIGINALDAILADKLTQLVKKLDSCLETLY